jgi:hypothetical protein
VTPPETGSDTDALEIERLKRRIRELEEEKHQGAAAGQPAYQAPAAPYGSEQGYPPPGGSYGGGAYGQPGSGGQEGRGYRNPAGGQANRWYYREDSNLPPAADQ